jgi:hypothetical protein
MGFAERMEEKHERDVAGARRAAMANPPKPKPNGKVIRAYPDLLNGYDPEDVGNGQRFIAVHGRNVRYCLEQNKWFFWDGSAGKLTTEIRSVSGCSRLRRSLVSKRSERITKRWRDLLPDAGAARA